MVFCIFVLANLQAVPDRPGMRVMRLLHFLSRPSCPLLTLVYECCVCRRGIGLAQGIAGCLPNNCRGVCTYHVTASFSHVSFPVPLWDVLVCHDSKGVWMTQHFLKIFIYPVCRMCQSKPNPGFSYCLSGGNNRLLQAQELKPHFSFFIYLFFLHTWYKR